MSLQPYNRRSFLGACLATGVATGVHPGIVLGCPELKRCQSLAPADGRIRVGMIADVHQDVMHDGEERVQKFINDMKHREASLIVNLGDFCVPHPRNDSFLAVWNQFEGARLHVLGNHDMDGGRKREQTVEFYGCPARYYSYDHQGIHFVILDGNDPDGKPGYACSVNEAQREWLRTDLLQTHQPTVILIHQPIDAYDQHVRTAVEVRKVLAEANQLAGYRKVIAVFCGHAHLDYVKESDGIPHVQINSASYVWVDKRHANYPPEIQQAHPSLAATCPYAEPLWAFVSFDCQRGEIVIEGRETTWVGPDPWEVGLAEDSYQRSRELCRPAISGRTLAIGGQN
jgi:Icc protein